MVHGKNRIPYWIDRRLTGLAGPDDDATISFGLPFEPEDSQYGEKRAQRVKKKRSSRAKRNTKVVYLLQHLLRCGECGRNFHARSTWTSTSIRNGKKYRYDLPTPRRYYMCNGMQSLRLRCRERTYIRAERLEEPIWSEVKRVIQNPNLIVAGIVPLDSQETGGLKEQIALAERDLRTTQTREERAITLFVSGKITEDQLDNQRKFITERLENVRAKLDDYRAWVASDAEKLRLTEAILAWARDVGQGLDELTLEQRKEFLQMVVEEVIVDGNDNVTITLTIPIDSKPTTEDSVSVQTLENVQTLEPSFLGINKHGKLRYSWAVGLGPFKPGRIFRAECPH